MTYILLHNPGCGSSKKGLALLEENGVQPEIRKYATATGKLNLEEIKDLAVKMGNVSPRVFLREKDAVKAGLPETASDEEVFAAMAENPKLIQRPIGINGKKAVLGRPNDRLLEIV
jgi:arsenate reductase